MVSSTLPSSVTILCLHRGRYKNQLTYLALAPARLDSLHFSFVLFLLQKARFMLKIRAASILYVRDEKTVSNPVGRNSLLSYSWIVRRVTGMFYPDVSQNSSRSFASILWLFAILLQGITERLTPLSKSASSHGKSTSSTIPFRR